ncbi:hypothetical protein J3B02_000014 [Coemansia erecta]|uniref:GST N-terminal domain-containing protein n=1 Tax=Coemansia asiatica TaxID=1052880 RepID=A0A9W8CK40_9FUNG|nr:hypothetical protein LPJ64_002882 [Coemansia asiatica]KAJ2858635.1 hypothetical protein J3B02_000014 [Coemansia erecta]KAJ2887074.1 hypothetical protein FB639_001447 [Coemansia asiatica]
MSSFILRYFDLQARAEIIKAILTYAGANWKLESPAWPEKQEEQPIGQLPVLIETKEDGTQFVLSDSLAIENYLLRKFSMHAEESYVQVAREIQLRNQLMDCCQQSSYFRFGESEETRQNAKCNLISLTRMTIAYHEEILKENGSTGFYFDSKIGYADMALYSLYHALLTVDGLKETVLELFSNESAPLINKVLRNVESEPKLAEFVATFN